VRGDRGRPTTHDSRKHSLTKSPPDFGVRHNFVFDADRGFFLNGKPLKIKGVCNHQDFAGVGI